MASLSLQNINSLDWEKEDGLLPIIVQDSSSLKILMLGYTSREALEKTLQEQVVWFWSRSKKRLWKKGESSGNILSLVDIWTDCDQDTILASVHPKGPTCHTGTTSCFDAGNTKPDYSPSHSSFTLDTLFHILEQRKQELPSRSYTTKLFSNSGLIESKMHEELGELLEATSQNNIPSHQRIIEEASDLLFHFSALLVQRNISVQEIFQELQKRNNPEYTHKNDHINRK